MQLPDEAIAYDYKNLLAQPLDEWTPAAELRQQHFLSPDALQELTPRVLQVRSQVATERELKQIPQKMQPLQAGFINLPQTLLDAHKRNADASVLGRILKLAGKMRDEVDRFVVLGIGGSYMGARVLFEAMRSACHNDLPAKDRTGTPRISFEGNNADNDTLHELFEMLSITCIDPDQREERWGVSVISKGGDTLETAAAFRAIRREMIEYYGHHSPRLKNLLVPITGETGKLRSLCNADGIPDENILTIPDDIGGRYSVFTPVGLFPAAVMGLDVRALLLGAAAMTKRFLEERFENNPVLQFAAVNYLMYTRQHKPIRVMSVWSKKLEAMGLWYDQLLAESLGKQGTGPTPITALQTRDMHSRGQQHQDGSRDKVINNLVVKAWANPPVMIGMSDRNEDDLNRFNRKSLPDVMKAAREGTNKACYDAARPTADIVLPVISEHTLGQLMQMLMLATVVEGRLLGVNPYGQPGVQAYKTNMIELLKQQTQ
ncbi:MAG: glucose-6-phosphate isomerase [Planctomycetes bacterium]|nr:glucose-6-phosphate isomerase [Planctomycetota bacterium]